MGWIDRLIWKRAAREHEAQATIQLSQRPHVSSDGTMGDTEPAQQDRCADTAVLRSVWTCACVYLEVQTRTYKSAATLSRCAGGHACGHVNGYWINMLAETWTAMRMDRQMHMHRHVDEQAHRHVSIAKRVAISIERRSIRGGRTTTSSRLSLNSCVRPSTRCCAMLLR